MRAVVNTDPSTTPQALSGPQLLAHYGVTTCADLGIVPQLRRAIVEAARDNKLGDVHGYFLNSRRTAWEGETEGLFIVGERGYIELSLPSLRPIRVGTLYSMNGQMKMRLTIAEAA